MNNLFIEVMESPGVITQLSSHEIVIRVFSDDERQQEQHRIKITREDTQQINVTVNGVEILTHHHKDGKLCIAYLDNKGNVCDIADKLFCNL